jgi:hypothetical protein
MGGSKWNEISNLKRGYEGDKHAGKFENHRM